MKTVSASLADSVGLPSAGRRPRGRTVAQPLPPWSGTRPVRVFHWLMAASFAAAYLTAESERWRLLHGHAGLPRWPAWWCSVCSGAWSAPATAHAFAGSRARTRPRWRAT